MVTELVLRETSATCDPELAAHAYGEPFTRFGAGHVERVDAAGIAGSYVRVSSSAVTWIVSATTTFPVLYHGHPRLGPAPVTTVSEIEFDPAGSTVASPELDYELVESIVAETDRPSTGQWLGAVYSAVFHPVDAEDVPLSVDPDDFPAR